MKKSKSIKLTRKTAVHLIRSAVPVPVSSIEGGDQGTGAVIYEAHTGSMDITCSNDWYTLNGCIQLVVADRSGMGQITMYFSPVTLERDFAAEEAYKEEIQQEMRRNWVWRIGKENAHKLVDQYWGD